jgi:membrane protease subunit (stomatin/prohibitin family)
MATGEIIDRVMTNAEHTEWQAQQAEAEAQAEAAAAKVAARQAVLDKLKLTADEAAALLG